MEKRQRSRVVKRPSVSQQQDTLFSDDDSDPLVHCDNDQNITNDTPTFEDKPEHLYGKKSDSSYLLFSALIW